PRLTRKPGMEREDALQDETTPQDESLVSKGLKFAEGLFGSKKPTEKSVSETEHAEINVITVASGHLYDRMLFIMILSDMEHTDH
ncbi:hypothetical protein OFC04_26835, partial [Escherichia coli]|nr:hypothetical protein [Escherichia coli]